MYTQMHSFGSQTVTFISNMSQIKYNLVNAKGKGQIDEFYKQSKKENKIGTNLYV